MDMSKVVFGQRLTFAIPGDEVDEQGQEAILQSLVKATGYTPYDLRSTLPSDWTWRWHQPNGSYVGNLPKRIQSWAFKKLKHKLAPKQVENIGNISRQHSAKETTFHFDFDQTLLWKAGQFGDSKSCFWTEKKTALPLLRSAHCFALRLYTGPGPKDNGIGRAWVLPWRGEGDGLVEPGTDPLGLLIFNGYGLFKHDYQAQIGTAVSSHKEYGEMQTLDFARMLSLYLGVSYVRIQLMANGDTSSPMWFNNNGLSATLIAPADTIAKYKPAKEDDDLKYPVVNLDWDEEFVRRMLPRCSCCKQYLNQVNSRGELLHEVRVPGRVGRYCQVCIRTKFGTCQVCARLHLLPEMRKYTSHDGKQSWYYCAEHEHTHTFVCAHCRKPEHLYNRQRVLRQTEAGRFVFMNSCYRCATMRPTRDCQDCGLTFLDSENTAPPNTSGLEVVCGRCRRKRQARIDRTVEPEDEIDPAETLAPILANPVPDIVARFRQYAAATSTDERSALHRQWFSETYLDGDTLRTTSNGQHWYKFDYGDGQPYVLQADFHMDALHRMLSNGDIRPNEYRRDQVLPYTVKSCEVLAWMTNLYREDGVDYNPLFHALGHYSWNNRLKRLSFHQDRFPENWSPENAVYLGKFRIRELLLTYPEFFDLIATLYHQEGFGRVMVWRWNPEGEIELQDESYAKILSWQHPELAFGVPPLQTPPPLPLYDFELLGFRMDDNDRPMRTFKNAARLTARIPRLSPDPTTGALYDPRTQSYIRIITHDNGTLEVDSASRPPNRAPVLATLGKTRVERLLEAYRGIWDAVIAYPDWNDLTQWVWAASGDVWVFDDAGELKLSLLADRLGVTGDPALDELTLPFRGDWEAVRQRLPELYRTRPPTPTAMALERDPLEDIFVTNRAAAATTTVATRRMIEAMEAARVALEQIPAATLAPRVSIEEPFALSHYHIPEATWTALRPRMAYEDRSVNGSWINACVLHEYRHLPQTDDNCYEVAVTGEPETPEMNVTVFSPGYLRYGRYIQNTADGLHPRFEAAERQPRPDVPIVLNEEEWFRLLRYQWTVWEWFTQARQSVIVKITFQWKYAGRHQYDFYNADDEVVATWIKGGLGVTSFAP